MMPGARFYKHSMHRPDSRGRLAHRQIAGYGVGNAESSNEIKYSGKLLVNADEENKLSQRGGQGCCMWY